MALYCCKAIGEMCNGIGQACSTSCACLNNVFCNPEKPFPWMLTFTGFVMVSAPIRSIDDALKFLLCVPVCSVLDHSCQFFLLQPFCSNLRPILRWSPKLVQTVMCIVVAVINLTFQSTCQYIIWNLVRHSNAVFVFVRGVNERKKISLVVLLLCFCCA